MIEVCVDSLDAALMAVDSGADRIELSERLSVGGVSPNIQLIRSVRAAISVPLVVLIRCRDGDFYFDASQKVQMLSESCQAVELGADAIAIGGLRSDNSLDFDFLHSLTSLQLDCEWVMHRAFDSVNNPSQELDLLVQLGFDRILTSGGALRAVDSLDALREWNLAAAKRLEILPAGGIHSFNAQRVLQESHCRQLHGSFTKRPEQASESRLPSLSAGMPIAEEILQVRRLLDRSNLASTST